MLMFYNVVICSLSSIVLHLDLVPLSLHVHVCILFMKKNVTLLSIIGLKVVLSGDKIDWTVFLLPLDEHLGLPHYLSGDSKALESTFFVSFVCLFSQIIYF